MFTIPGIRVHDALEWMFTFGWNLRSRCPGICASLCKRGAYALPWCITLDNSKGISRLRFWAKKRRVNGINDLPVFMHQGSIAPGAETLRELFGGEPTLILLDELSVYLRKVQKLEDARDQLTAFLTSLFKAVESAPNAVLVYTLAIGKDGRATDAYNEENQFIADHMAEAESVSARKATLLNPTEEDETVQVLLRRLFESVDTTKSPTVIDGGRSILFANWR